MFVLNGRNRVPGKCRIGAPQAPDAPAFYRSLIPHPTQPDKGPPKPCPILKPVAPGPVGPKLTSCGQYRAADGPQIGPPGPFWAPPSADLKSPPCPGPPPSGGQLRDFRHRTKGRPTRQPGP